MGLPVALITATARIPTVTKKRDGSFAVRHFFAERLSGSLEKASVQRSLARFGYHRQLRLAGCDEGEVVEIGGQRVRWHYPSGDFEAANWPSGFGKWHSTIDGIKKFRPIETPDPTVGLDAEEIASRVAALTPEVLNVLRA